MKRDKLKYVRAMHTTESDWFSLAPFISYFSVRVYVRAFLETLA